MLNPVFLDNLLLMQQNLKASLIKINQLVQNLMLSGPNQDQQKAIELAAIYEEAINQSSNLESIIMALQSQGVDISEIVEKLNVLSLQQQGLELTIKIQEEQLELQSAGYQGIGEISKNQQKQSQQQLQQQEQQQLQHQQELQKQQEQELEELLEEQEKLYNQATDILSRIEVLEEMKKAQPADFTPEKQEELKELNILFPLVYAQKIDNIERVLNLSNRYVLTPAQAQQMKKKHEKLEKYIAMHYVGPSSTAPTPHKMTPDPYGQS
jgi:hypothetical protein